MATGLKERGVSRIHSFAWRDLDDPESGGSEIHADHIFSLWAQQGLEITHRTSTSDASRDFERNGYRVIQKSGRYGIFPSAVAHEIRNGKDSRDAVLEIWNGVPWFSQLWARVPTNVWLHHVHGPMWHQSLPPGVAHIGRYVESHIAPHFYRRTPIVTLSNSGREELLELGFKSNKVHVVNPGVDNSFSKDETVEGTQNPSLVAVGRLAPVKRFDLLIDLTVRLRNRIPGLTLSIVGDGPDREDLQHRIHALNADSYISLRGRLDQPELINLYRQTWLLTSTSLAEGWGMTITEAGACGTPSVVIDNAGHRDATVDNVTGIVSPNLEQLESDLYRGLTDEGLRERLSRGALERSHLLRWDHAATATLRHLYDEVVRRQSS